MNNKKASSIKRNSNGGFYSIGTAFPPEKWLEINAVYSDMICEHGFCRVITLPRHVR